MTNQTTHPSQPTLTPASAHQLTETLLSIAALRSAPTFDWTSIAAQAMARIHPETTIGLIVATHNKDHARVTAESTGVGSCWESTPSDPNGSQLDDPFNPEHARCALDRIDAALIQIPQDSLTTGYVTHASKLLPNWIANPLSEPWNTNHPNSSSKSIAAYAPIHHADDSSSSTVPCLLAFVRTDSCSLPTLSAMLAEAMSALIFKARRTFVTNTLNQSAYANFKPNPFQWLTQREQTILDHLVEGKSVRVIAECIGRSPHTVHDHVKNLHRKLNACSRGQLIARALGHPTPPTQSELLCLTIDPELIETCSCRTTQQTRAIPELKLTQSTQDADLQNADTLPQPIRATPLNCSTESSRVAL